jgi:hypothetical protein
MTNAKIHTRGQLVFIIVVLAFLAWVQLGHDLSAHRVAIPAASGARVEAWQVWEPAWLPQYRPLLGPGLFTLAILVAGVRVWFLHPRREDWDDVDWPGERLPLRYRRKRTTEAGS